MQASDVMLDLVGQNGSWKFNGWKQLRKFEFKMSDPDLEGEIDAVKKLV